MMWPFHVVAWPTHSKMDAKVSSGPLSSDAKRTKVCAAKVCYLSNRAREM